MAGAEARGRIGKYVVDAILGQGGMGVVYKAHDSYRQVAIKMMLASLSANPSLRARFHREAQFTANLHHPNIVTVYDWGEEDDAPYLVMEFLEGRSLDRWQIDAPPPTAMLKKLNIITQACAGLKYAHDRNIVHRDIKPANIFVLNDDSVKLLDFGVARLKLDGDTSAHGMTRTGQIVGSLQYMSPEQANGTKLDHRTDIFSMGVVLYELLSGVLPFRGRDTISTITKILTANPEPLSEYLPDCPTELVEATQRSLEKATRDRYQSADELSFDLSLVQAQLRRQIAGEFLELAETALERSDWLRARDTLVELLKMDREHARGLDLFREVQQIIRRQDRASEAASLRSQAAEAFEKRLFRDALELAEEAVSLDGSNYDLIVFRDEIKASLNRAEKARMAAERAESNLRAERLDAAQSSVKEALSLDPSNTLAQQLQTKIAQAMAEQARRSQLQSLMSQARQDLANRRYTSALTLLREAEALEAPTPESRSLLQQAIQGRDRESRERELKGLGDDIRKQIAASSLDAAEAALASALGRFPAESSLLELERAVFQLRQAKRVRLAMERAESSLLAELFDDARAAVDEALVLDPSNAAAKQLQTKIEEARSAHSSRVRVRVWMEQARQELNARRFDRALELFRTVQSVDPNTPNLTALIQQAEEGRDRDKRERELKVIGDEVRKLISARDLDLAGKKLTAGLSRFPAEPDLMELEKVLAQLRRTHRVRLALDRAEASLRAEQFDAAREAVKQALALDSANLEAHQLQVRIGQAAAEASQRTRVSSLLERVRQSLAAKNYSSALKLLKEAESLNPTFPELAALSQQAVQGQEREKRERQLKGLCEEAAKLISASNLEAAGEKLALALEQFPAEPALLELQRKVSALRRAELLRSAIERAQCGLNEERLGDAQSAVDEALSLDPANADAKQLQKSVSQALAAQFKRSQARSLVEQARQEMDKHRLANALVLLKKAESLDAAAPELSGLVEAIVQGQEQEKRERVLTGLCDEISKLCRNRKFGSAQSKLASALNRFPGEPRLLELERALDEERGKESEPAPARPREEIVLRSETSAESATIEDRGLTRPDSIVSARETQPAPTVVLSQPAHRPARPARPAKPSEPALEVAPAQQISPRKAHSKTLDREPAPQPFRRRLIWAAAGAVLLVVVVVGVMVILPRAPKVPVAAAVDVSIASTPTGASVHVSGNGQSLDCITPKCALSLPAGAYTLKATLTGYQSSEQALGAQPGMAPVEIHLMPVSLVDASGTAASLVVQTPGVQGTRVFVDGREFPTSGSELRISGTKDKTYKIEVQKEGYEPSPAQMLKLSHATETLVVRMKELPNAATLVLSNATANADVMIDGVATGVVGGNGSFSAKLPPGTHNIQLASGGRTSNQISRPFNTRETVQISSLSVPLPAPSQVVMPNPPLPQPQPPPPAPVDTSEQDWNAVQNSSDRGQLSAFLVRHSSGPYADKAHARLNELERQEWEAAKNSGDEQRIQSYLNNNQQGRFANDARAQLQSIHDKGNANQLAADERAIREAMSAYRQAYENRSIDQMRRVWPSIPAQVANSDQQTFRAASAIQLTLREKSMKVSGDTASAECDQTFQITAGGNKQTVSQSSAFSFQKKAGVWVIDRVDTSKSH